MVKFVNGLTGGDMWVHESRVDEYLRAGHKLALAPAPEEAPKPVQKKRSTAKPKK